MEFEDKGTAIEDLGTRARESRMGGICYPANSVQAPTDCRTMVVCSAIGLTANTTVFWMAVPWTTMP